jgi:hypothetical protein
MGFYLSKLGWPLIPIATTKNSIATNPIPNVIGSRYLDLAAELEALSKEVPQELKEDTGLCARILEAAQKLVPALEKPDDTAQRIIYTVRIPIILIRMSISSNGRCSRASLWQPRLALI